MNISYILMEIIIPILLIICLCFTGKKSQLSLFMLLLCGSCYFIWLHFIGIPGIAGIPINYFTKYIFFIIFIIQAIVILIKIKYIPSMPKKNKIFIFSTCIISVILTTLLMVTSVNDFNAHFYDDEPVKLSFPYKNGIYAIQYGGDGAKSFHINYHYKSKKHISSNTNNSMRYATDIIKLSTFGNARCIPSENLWDYEIFGEPIYSPCDGVIVSAIDYYEDNSPFSRYFPYNTGNTIIIKYDSCYILLGHLKKDSIKVKAMDVVSEGQLLAETGNSGYTSQPHLHIQAMRSISWSSEGIPILFDDRFPVKNNLFIRYN